MDYRGLSHSLHDDESKNRYAVGWYGAMSKNYPNWKYEYQRRNPEDPEGTFEFEGTYREGATIFRKIGRLRFRGKRLHAIYYTAPDEDFDIVRNLFERMDSMHRYFSPQNR